MWSLTWGCGDEGICRDRTLSDPVVVRSGGQRPRTIAIPACTVRCR